LRLKYQGCGEYDDDVVDIDETIWLRRFRQPFGGYRWYFICPNTNRRCTVLYQPPGVKRFRSRWGFRCRLQYRSQQLSPIHRYRWRGAGSQGRCQSRLPALTQLELAQLAACKPAEI
jgi:hypothetical protein